MDIGKTKRLPFRRAFISAESLSVVANVIYILTTTASRMIMDLEDNMEKDKYLLETELRPQP